MASALASPTLTVSACRVTSPVPFGIRFMFPFDVDTMFSPLTSSGPPNWGVRSLTRSVLGVRLLKMPVFPPPSPVTACVEFDAISTPLDVV